MGEILSTRIKDIGEFLEEMFWEIVSLISGIDGVDWINRVNGINGINGIDWINRVNGIDGAISFDEVIVEIVHLDIGVKLEVWELVKISVSRICLNNSDFALFGPDRNGIVRRLEIIFTKLDFRPQFESFSSLHVNAWLV